ncbi:MAG: hypothetical protein AAGH15_16605, partial [Myxococcota bacterium]
RLVLRLLAKDPAERFADADAVTEALEATGLEARWTRDAQEAWWSRRAPLPGSVRGSVRQALAG